MLCKHCGSYRDKPCPDCEHGECTMNCGPAKIDVRGIFDAADAEFAAADKHALVTPDEARAMRDAVRGMMVRMGLYGLWQHCRPENKNPCPKCGCEERGQGGYLTCQCPA